MRQKFALGALPFVVCAISCSRGASPVSRATSPVSPSSGSEAVVANACRTIVDNSGPLLLKQDLSGLDQYCLRFVGGSGELDCQGHNVQGVELDDVRGFSVRNCRMRIFAAARSSDVTLADNTMTADSVKTVGAVVRFTEGSGNRIVQNTIDGSWRGQPSAVGGYPPGADDGIVIENEANVMIEANTILNIWDCGIERLGNRTDPAAIRNNTIANAGECGIGSWFAAGWRDSVVVGNVVSNSGSFAEIFFSPNQNKGVDRLTFRNNVFEANQFRSPANRNQPSVKIDYLTGASRMSVDVANNVFRNNDFGADVMAPALSPPSGFIDGGENICRQDGKSTLNCAR